MMAPKKTSIGTACAVLVLSICYGIFQLEVEVAKAADVPFPPPLDEGVTTDMFQDYIKTPPPTPSPEVCIHVFIFHITIIYCPF